MCIKHTNLNNIKHKYLTRSLVSTFIYDYLFITYNVSLFVYINLKYRQYTFLNHLSEKRNYGIFVRFNRADFNPDCWI